MSKPTRDGQLPGVRLGCVAAQVLLIICHEPSCAYAGALYARLAKAHGKKYTRSDVGLALKFLVAHKVLEARVEDPTKSNSRVFYKPTLLAGFYLAILMTKGNG